MKNNRCRVLALATYVAHTLLIISLGVFPGQANVILREVASASQAEGGEAVPAELEPLLSRPRLVHHQQLSEADN